MQLLTDHDRKYVLKQLEMAPDSVLAEAMLAFNAIRDKVLAVRSLASGSPSEPVPQARKNFCPGTPTVSRVGTGTKADIFNLLHEGRQPADTYFPHCCLLWERGEIKFDGEFYL
jgi:hypothetical protein